MYTHAHKHISSQHTHIHNHIHIHRATCIYIHYTHKYKYIYAYTHIHIHIHTHQFNSLVLLYTNTPFFYSVYHLYVYLFVVGHLASHYIAPFGFLAFSADYQIFHHTHPSFLSSF